MLNKLLKSFNFQLIKTNQSENKFPDFEPSFNSIMETCKPFTMTSEERLYSFNKAVEYIVKNNNRNFFLYDTFEGMSEPSDMDADLLGVDAKNLLSQSEKTTEDVMWCYAPIDDVKNNIAKTQYPSNLINYVKGKVEDTIPETMPNKIAILRLDTDWYESTYHELVHLFPKLVKGGVIIIDDYGHWKGAREAVDQYFKEQGVQILLNRIDYTGRIGIKN
jgi:hypothetical protein